MGTKNEALSLSDSTIGQIAKVLQLALLSGTDIVDHLRMMRLVNEDGMLVLDSDYASSFETNLEKTVEELASAEAAIDILGDD
jgi:hypothetical protein